MCPKEQVIFLPETPGPESCGVRVGEEGEEARRYCPFFSSPNYEISKMLTLSTTTFSFITNANFFSENKMDIL